MAIIVASGLAAAKKTPKATFWPMDEPTSRPTDQKMIYIVACPGQVKKKELTNIAKFEPDIEPISEQRKGMLLPKYNGVLNKTLGRLLSCIILK